MSQSTAFPFELRSGTDTFELAEITSTTETVHGLLRMEGDRLVIQWRRSRSTEVVGLEIRTDKEHEPVREESLPLAALAGAAVRWRLFRWPPGRYLVLTAADLRAFDAVAGASGPRLDHPAELATPIRRAARAAALEFSSELNLTLAERTLREVEDAAALPRSSR
jgi:hypothetical protein